MVLQSDLNKVHLLTQLDDLRFSNGLDEVAHVWQQIHLFGGNSQQALISLETDKWAHIIKTLWLLVVDATADPHLLLH